jgi:hypothetical protein
MCTVIKLSQKGRPKIAKCDIEVYKACNVVGGNIISASERFRYEKGVKYETKFSYEEDGCYGDHIECEYYTHCGVETLFVAEGFHSYSSLIRAKKCWSYYDADRPEDTNFFFKFIIPKGAKYYENNAECLVSNAIMLVDDKPVAH